MLHMLCGMKAGIMACEFEQGRSPVPWYFRPPILRANICIITVVILCAQRPLVASKSRWYTVSPANPRRACSQVSLQTETHTRIVGETLPILVSVGSSKANGITSYIFQAQEYACLYVIAIVWLIINGLIGCRWEPIEASMGGFLQRMWMYSVKCTE